MCQLSTIPVIAVIPPALPTTYHQERHIQGVSVVYKWRSMSHRVGDGSVLIDEEIYHRAFSSFEIHVSESACLQNITYDKEPRFRVKTIVVFWYESVWQTGSRTENWKQRVTAEFKGIIEIVGDFLDSSALQYSKLAALSLLKLFFQYVKGSHKRGSTFLNFYIIQCLVDPSVVACLLIRLSMKGTNTCDQSSWIDLISQISPDRPASCDCNQETRVLRPGSRGRPSGWRPGYLRYRHPEFNSPSMILQVTKSKDNDQATKLCLDLFITWAKFNMVIIIYLTCCHLLVVFSNMSRTGNLFLKVREGWRSLNRWTFGKVP